MDARSTFFLFIECVQFIGWLQKSHTDYNQVIE